MMGDRTVYIKEATERVRVEGGEAEEGGGGEGGGERKRQVRDKPWENRVYCGTC